MKATQWPGLITNADPHDLPPGAAVVQENFSSRVPGKLVGRKGIRPVMFTTADSFGVELDPSLPDDVRKTLFGATFLIDFACFEKKH